METVTKSRYFCRRN